MGMVNVDGCLKMWVSIGVSVCVAEHGYDWVCVGKDGRVWVGKCQCGYV